MLELPKARMDVEVSWMSQGVLHVGYVHKPCGTGKRSQQGLEAMSASSTSSAWMLAWQFSDIASGPHRSGESGEPIGSTSGAYPNGQDSGA